MFKGNWGKCPYPKARGRVCPDLYILAKAADSSAGPKSHRVGLELKRLER